MNTTTHREKIPDELKNRPQWVNWRLELDERGKSTKRPYIPHKDTWASVTDSETWRPFEEASRAFDSGQYDGIGFVFSR